MKRDNISTAHRLEGDLRALETKLEHFKDIKRFSIQSACCMELAEYDQPSRIGQAFREVREAICALLVNQVADLRAELKRLGVED